MVKISSIFVAFLENMNFNKKIEIYIVALFSGDEENFPVQMNGDLLLMDELLTEIGFCGHVVDFMLKFNLITDKRFCNCLTGFVNVYKQFKNLIGSYFAIILQEGKL